MERGEKWPVEHDASGDTVPLARHAMADLHLIRSLLIGIFIFTAVYALYFARDFFMPVILAFMLALMLTPIVRLLRKHGHPRSLSATLLVFLSIAFARAHRILHEWACHRADQRCARHGPRADRKAR